MLYAHNYAYTVWNIFSDNNRIWTSFTKAMDKSENILSLKKIEYSFQLK